MIVNNRVNHQTVARACKQVENHYKDEAFLQSVASIRRFNHTGDSGKQVAQKIQESQLNMFVKPYTSKWPWSRAIGYARGNEIYLNTRKLNLPIEERIGNIMHEAMHLLGYTHMGNRVSQYNDNTVPYKVGNLFAQYVSGLNAKDA